MLRVDTWLNHTAFCVAVQYVFSRHTLLKSLFWSSSDSGRRRSNLPACLAYQPGGAVLWQEPRWAVWGQWELAAKHCGWEGDPELCCSDSSRSALHAELGSGVIARETHLRGAANSQHAPRSDPGVALWLWRYIKIVLGITFLVLLRTGETRQSFRSEMVCCAANYNLSACFR